MSRPEDSLAADVHYDDAEARKYTTNSRIQAVQASMTRRALELLALSEPSFVLDVGCGSGLSGETLSLSSREGGPHTWIGLDVAPAMLDIALQRDVEGDLLLADAGQGLPFRAGTFDAAISISAIQWLCSAPSSDTSPVGRLTRFFNSLYAVLKRGGRAVCQFYPSNAMQREIITRAAIKAGFGAGILEDDPNTKHVKLYLVLMAGCSSDDTSSGDITGVVAGMDDIDVLDGRSRSKACTQVMKPKRGSKAWIVKKKEQIERKGKIVKATSKYSGRKRRTAF